MGYKYYNQFNLSDELSQAISSIISKKENDEYICKTILVTIPEHDGLVFSYPKTYCEDIITINDTQIIPITEEYEKYVQGRIPEKEHSFLVIMKKESYEKFSKLSFKNQEEINMALQLLSLIYQEYNGIFDPKTLSENFPYLQEFFTDLDEWRAKTGRVTVDRAVLNAGLKRILTKNN